MKKGTLTRDRYLGAPEVVQFKGWLAQRLRGEPIEFEIVGGARYPYLRDALAAYCWPPALKAGLPNPDGHRPHVHPEVPDLFAGSSLAENEVVLTAIQRVLRTTYASPESDPRALSGAVAAVLHWGGVYTEPSPRKGNAGWLQANQSHLRGILQAVVNDHARGFDSSSVVGLRFNSGMTKVYSLLIDGFIIYDSRVAAALAWLVQRWWTTRSEREAPATKPGEHLLFSERPVQPS